MIYCDISIWCEKLVGGIPTPLKNDWLSQLGWWHSQHMESHKSHVPNHYRKNVDSLQLRILIFQKASSNFKEKILEVSRNMDQLFHVFSTSLAKCSTGHGAPHRMPGLCSCWAWRLRLPPSPWRGSPRRVGCFQHPLNLEAQNYGAWWFLDFYMAVCQNLVPL